ncbi:unnamed protein product [Candidula unifasciata]|uniref:Large ribosomal subunit protein mL64 n=1 Tax=Candidula unifasciata TaxID=100452 RepID=A0A8S3YJG6_9EUPU|nr:unnamed protein product [Candidula unifasciata]
MASLPSLTLKLIARRSQSSLRCGLITRLSRSYTTAREGTQISDEEEQSRINNLRNASGLPENLYKIYHGQAPNLSYKDLHKRKMLYAQLGAASGEDPRILWPSRAKLLDMEQEEIEEGSPLAERFARIQAEKVEAEKAKLERRNIIAKNMQQMPKLIAEYKKKQANIEAAAKERAAKKEILLQEARDVFGYKVQAHDPKFLQMTEEKELLEKAEKKKQKKEAKLKKSEQWHKQLSEPTPQDSTQT